MTERAIKLTLLLGMAAAIVYLHLNPKEKIASNADSQVVEMPPPPGSAIPDLPDSGAVQSSAGEGAPPESYLPVGKLQVDVMALTLPDRVIQLSQRLKASVQKNRDWFLQYGQTWASLGKPLPYDRRFGISKSEYDEVLSGSKLAIYQKKDEATLTIAAKGSGRYLLHGGDHLPSLTGIEVDLANNQVTTKYGVLDDRSRVNVPDTTALGAWNGVQWRREDANQASALSTDFALGRLSDSGKGVLLYDVKKLAADGRRTRIDYVLTFELVPQLSWFNRELDTLVK